MVGGYSYPGFIVLLFLSGVFFGIIIEGHMKDKRHKDEVYRLLTTIKRLQEELNCLTKRKRK
jgi:hypothetical protein